MSLYNQSDKSSTTKYVDRRGSVEQPSWLKACYGLICPCLLKNKLIEQKEILKICLQKNQRNETNGNINHINQYQLPKKNQSFHTNYQIQVQYQPSFKSSKIQNITRSVTQKVNSDISNQNTIFKSFIGKGSSFPIYKLPQKTLISIGTESGKLLCMIKNVIIQPCQIALKKTQQSIQNERKRQLYFNYLDKVWSKRYYLFQKFDQGIKLDQQSWYTTIPQAVAEHVASNIRCQLLMDVYCGVGSTSIKFANTCHRVISYDCSLSKLQCLVTNSKIYGAENIEVTRQNFLTMKNINPDILFISPPSFNKGALQSPTKYPPAVYPSIDKIITKAIQLSRNFIFLFPSNIEIQKIIGIIAQKLKNSPFKTSTCSIKIQKVIYLNKFISIILYYGLLTQNEIKLNDQLKFIYNLLKQQNANFKHKRIVRQVRQQHGMVKLLNYIYQSQNLDRNCTNMENFENYLLENGYLTKAKLKNLLIIQQKQDQIRQKKLSSSDINQQEKTPQGQLQERTNSEISAYQKFTGRQSNDQVLSPYRRSSSNYTDIQVTNLEKLPAKVILEKIPEDQNQP